MRLRAPISHEGGAWPAAAADNRALAVGLGDGSIVLVDPATGTEYGLLNVNGHQLWVYSLAFAPDGRTLASVGRDHTLRLWHVPTEQELFVLPRLDYSEFSTIDFSPGGNRLATATNDNGGYGQVLVWSLRSDVPPAWQRVIEAK